MPSRAVIAFNACPLRCAELARAAGSEVEVACDLRTPTGRDRLERALYSGTFDILVVDSIVSLAAHPLEALRSISTMCAGGIKVRSVTEPWLPDATPVLAQLLDWVDARKKAIRVRALRDALSRSERRPGRPRRQIDPARATTLLDRLPVDAAARELGVGGATLRRWIKAQREEQQLGDLLHSAGQEAA